MLVVVCSALGCDDYISPRQELKSRVPVGVDGTPAVLWLLPAGAVAGVLAQSLTYPGDTVRKLMITNGANGSPRAYSTTWVRTRCIVGW